MHDQKPSEPSEPSPYPDYEPVERGSLPAGPSPYDGYKTPEVLAALAKAESAMAQVYVGLETSINTAVDLIAGPAVLTPAGVERQVEYVYADGMTSAGCTVEALREQWARLPAVSVEEVKAHLQRLGLAPDESPAEHARDLCPVARGGA